METKPIKCPKCDATFQKATGLGSHMRSAHGIAGTSTTAVALREANKAGEHGPMWAYRQKNGKYKCPECQALLSNGAALGSHRYIVHQISGVGAEAKRNRTKRAPHYDCSECGAKFETPLKLGNHRWTVHKIPGESDDAKRRHEGYRRVKTEYERTPDGRLKCPLCEFTGTGHSGMGMHMKWHRTQGHDVSTLNSPPVERTAIVKANQNAIAQTNNGTHHHQQAEDDRNHRLEAAATLAAGRVQELCSRLAFEHDVPPRTLTALVLRTVAATSALR